ncbi:BQ5605_C010g05871 [Microbotryum silenes-dioicae]|uniref:BQ5605_C010g05871 protein n=1 Tax=Microbotryum silenes-dioicae TaxID=796604 RepID=A0A2X0NM29_9BASI|nr:BQ5605_C010g05871 [Microbotryum silenes-dioicae]
MPPLGGALSSMTGSTSGSASPFTRYGSFPPGSGSNAHRSSSYGEDAREALHEILTRKLSHHQSAASLQRHLGHGHGGAGAPNSPPNVSPSWRSKGKGRERRRYDSHPGTYLHPDDRTDGMHDSDGDSTASEDNDADSNSHPRTRSDSIPRKPSGLRRSADDTDGEDDECYNNHRDDDDDDDLIWTAGENGTPERVRRSKLRGESDDPPKQWGTLKMELMGRTRGTGGLFTIYAGVYLISTLTSLEGQTTPTIEPYFLSLLGSHSLLSSVVIITSIAFAVGLTPTTKILDVFGRAEGVALAATIYSLGYFLTAAATSPTVYIVARAFSALGGQGLQLAQQIIVADTTTLSNRGLITSTISLPWLVTTWIGPALAQVFLSFGEKGYRAAYASFGLLLPLVSAVLFCTLMLEWRRIKKEAALVGRSPSTMSLGVGIGTRKDKMREVEAGRMINPSSKRRLSRGVLDQFNNSRRKRRDTSAWGKIAEVWKNLDVVGLTALTLGCTLFLLPLTLAAQRPESWNDRGCHGNILPNYSFNRARLTSLAPCLPSAKIWLLVAAGLVTLGFFCFYEFRIASIPLLPPRLLRNTTIVAGSVLGFFHFTSQFLYESFFTSYLQVARGHSAKTASYIAQSYIFSACVSALLAGWLAKVSNRYKFIGVIGVIAHAAGVWLMMRARDLDSSTFELILSQVIGGAGGGWTTIAAQIGVQSVVGHQDVGMATAIFLTITQIGGAVGGAGAGAIWSTLLPRHLYQTLPSPTPDLISKIMGSLPFAMSFPVGSQERIAIQQSYTETQKVLNWLALVTLIPALVAMLSMKNVNLEKDDRGQGEGVVVLGRASFLVSADEIHVDSETSSLLGGASDATRSEP